MQQEQIQKLFSQINVWKRGTERAPHKPLLLLYALAKCSRGEFREIPYTEIDCELRKLLIEFGPTRQTYHTEYPFWRLQNDGLWELYGAKGLESRQSNTDTKKSELLKHNVKGGFLKPIFEELCSNPRLLSLIAHEILDLNFPTSIHEDILAAVGLEIEIEHVGRKKRDPLFRARIMKAYEYRCAICGFDVRLGTIPLGLEAAHIKWHQAGGPDIESNGIALCSIHHKMFDRGAYTISEKLRIEVSEHVNGFQGFDEWLLKFHGEIIRSPQSPNYTPAIEYLKWHMEEVFHAPPRYL
jgi:putative restriction endonuclease